MESESSSRGSSSSAPRTDRQPTAALFQPVSHPILRSLDPRIVTKFLKERKRYEDEVKEKKKEVPSMTVASFKVSIDRSLLESMFFLGKFDDISRVKSADALTSNDIQKFIEGLVKRKEGDQVQPEIIEKALQGLRMPMHIGEAEARILEFATDFFSRLEEAGYPHFKEDNPKKTIGLMHDKVFPSSLKKAMERHLEYQKGLKNDLRAYINLLCKEAEISQRAESRKTIVPTPKPNKSQKSGSKSETKPKKWLPICLYPPCEKEGKKHFLSDCEDCPEDSKKNLLEEHKKKKGKQKGAKKVSRQQEDVYQKNSTLIRARFGGVETRMICADAGSDINLMPPDLYATLMETGARIETKTFQNERRFGLAAKANTENEPIYISCNKEVKVTTELFIRHGKSLTIRELVWQVANQEVKEPLLGRPILEALGLDTKGVLEAACDRYEGGVQANDLIKEEHFPEGSIARLMSNGLFHSDRAAYDYDDGSDSDDDWLDLGIDTKEEMDEALAKMVKKAAEEGLSKSGQETLSGVLETYRDVFRLRLGTDPPADVEPMKVVLKPGTAPVISKPRRYTSDQRDFMFKYMTKLKDYGFIAPNSNAMWAAAPLMVPKAPPANYRLTFDLTPANARTVPVSWPMPNIEAELMDVAESKVFATIDFCSGYWQLPLDEEGQNAHSFHTPFGIFKPLRTLQGAMNSGANFQSRVEPCFASLRESFKAWLDDFLFHAQTEASLLNTLREFLKICEQRKLKISARKSVLFTKQVRWCGRLIDEHGIQCDPRRLSGLKELHMPENAAELCQYLHCVQWMSSNIPDFANRTDALRNILEAAYNKAGSRKKKAIQKFSLDTLGWGSEHANAFKSLQETLRNAVKLSHRDYDKALCVFTDSSDEHWAAVVTQCVESELTKDTMLQKHEPLAFLSSSFRKAQGRWSTFEKEAYAILKCFRKLDYMLAGETNVHLYTDHRNLLFAFHPTAISPTVRSHVISKVQRWAVYLSAFSYTIEHVEGERNVMPDIMSRWLSGYRGKKLMSRRVSEISTAYDIVESPFSEEFVWPSTQMIMAEQKKFEKSKPYKSAKKEGNLYYVSKQVWIPDNSIKLQLKLLTVAHCGAGGHRGFESTSSALKEKFSWDSIANDCKEFVKQCIHCILSKTGNKIPRPLSSALHGNLPNEVIHFDFLYMGPSTTGHKYLFVIKDDVSSYIWLCPSVAANAETAAEELKRWIRTFTVMNTWVSDQGSHFKNVLMENLAGTHKIKHSFTVAYSPWVNGTVERVMRTVLAACNALLSELKLAPQDWTVVAGMVMTIINECPLKRLGSNEDGTYRSPLQVMTGIKPLRTQLIIGNGADIGKTRSLEKARAIQMLEINTLQSAIENMHKDVVEKVSKNRAKQIHQHNKNTNIVRHQFQLGDFVVVRVPDVKKKKHKLQFKWIGPKRVTAIVSDLVYDVTSIVDGKTDRVHSTRMQLYRADVDGKEASSKLTKQAEHSETKYEIIEELVDIGQASDGIFVQVQWSGLPDKCDWTWQKIEELHEDVPEELAAFLSNTPKKKLAKKARQALRIND